MASYSNNSLSLQSPGHSALAPEIVGALCAHAESSYPRECCGIIFASGRVAACTNISDKPNCFELSATDQIMLAESFYTPDPADILYHSHPDADPIPSHADVAGLTWRGSPMYPRLKQLIIEVRAGRVIRGMLQDRRGP
jgi:proteasome lid subunit RPN8/RPN11